MSFSNTQTKEARQVLMDVMPKDKQQRVLDLFKVQSTGESEHEMVSYLVRWLDKRNIYYEFDHLGNILVTKGGSSRLYGEHYQCICAHMDTVHKYSFNFTLHVRRWGQHQALYATDGKNQCGVGGDDKCGIFAVLEALDKFDVLKAVFFTQEETGLVGSSGIDLDWFSDVGSIIQLDRWGRSDLISKYYYSDTINEAFKDKASEFMSRYGFTHEEGLITDSINLFDREVGISCVNVSCGYYQHHTQYEFVDLNEFYNSLLFTMDLIDSLGSDRYDCEPAIYTYKKDRWNEYDYDWNTWESGTGDEDENHYGRINLIDYEVVLEAMDVLGIESIWNIVDVDEFYETYKNICSAFDQVTPEMMRSWLAMYWDENMN